MRLPDIAAPKFIEIPAFRHQYVAGLEFVSGDLCYWKINLSNVVQCKPTILHLNSIHKSPERRKST